MFNTIDALLGDSLVADAMNGADPALVNALITDSTVNAAGDVSVVASNEAAVDASVTNDTSALSVMATGSDTAVGGVIVAQNLVNVATRAAVTNTGTGALPLTAGGKVSVGSTETISSRFGSR